MTAPEIQNLCIAGTAAYLVFLETNNRGFEIIHVSRKEELQPSVYKLTLDGRLFDPECISLELHPPGMIYGPDSFRVVEYDNDSKILIIQVLNNTLNLNGVPIPGLRIVSDLRFLVRNVQRWYEENGLQIRLPNNPLIPDLPVQNTTLHLDTCQEDAVACSLENPLTYVWGPPGTGKTKHVLTQVALQLLQSQKRIGIFAPTNNALEQAMTAVINAAENEGIRRESFLRVGHPSTKFAASFPEICEIQGLTRKFSELRRQIGIYETVLNHRRGATVLSSVAMLRSDLEKLQDMLSQRRKNYEELARMRGSLLTRAVHFFDGKERDLNDHLTRIEKQINGMLAMLRQTQTESKRLNAIIAHIDFTNIEHIENNVTSLETAASNYLAVNQALADEYKSQSNEELHRLITDMNEQMAELNSQTVLERIKSSCVIGMTLDCFIGRFHDTLLQFDHIIVDEAGYVPLVKALTLCRGGIPLTFIGDHKQLGPVCEMDDNTQSIPINCQAIVWKKSALFIDEAFLANNQDAFVTQLTNNNEPQLRSFTMAHLNKTFRFGQNLANLLSNQVYQGIELVSAGDNQNLEIICLKAIPNAAPIYPRQSHAEVEAIKSYINGQLDLNTNCEEAYAILAPYKNQVALLSNSLVEERRQGRIMTIHKSQGREWDTVIISIVDGHFNGPWFTDTTNQQSGGLQVMNTAISRARKRLVIVCDVDYWSNQQDDQLISRLLMMEM